jgi:hypothetical protein
MHIYASFLFKCPEKGPAIPPAFDAGKSAGLFADKKFDFPLRLC